MGTAGMVPAFMQFSDGVNFLAGGIGQEVLDALRKADVSFSIHESMFIEIFILSELYI